MRQSTFAEAGFQCYIKRTLGAVCSGNGADRCLESAPGTGRARLQLEQARYRAYGSGSGSSAADSLSEALIQPVGSWGGGSAKRFPGDAAIRGHRPGPRAGAG